VAEKSLTKRAGIWRTLVPNSAPPTIRHEHSYVQAGGKFFLLGGRGNLPVDIYDPVTNTWEPHPPPPLELHHFQAVLYENLIWVISAYS
jgi:hypothetical protein